jgi:CHAT domain-containing protein
MTRWHEAILLTFTLIGLLAAPVRHAYAQLDDTQDMVLSAQERQRLMGVLNQPIDPNALNLTKSEKYREQVMAAHLLGDQVRVGELLKAWLAFEPAGDAKWKLTEWNWNAGQRDTALKLLSELTQERREPTQNVRLRAQHAFYMLQENNLAEAATQLAKAEEIIKYEFRNVPRRGSMPFWIARAELEFHLVKSELEAAQGKWAAAIDTSKLAVVKSKDILRMTSMVNNEDYASMGRRVVLMTQTQLGMRQTDSGLYADAEWTYRDTIKLVKQYGFNENQLPVLYDRIADLYNAAGQFNDGLLFGKKSEAIFVARQMDTKSTRWLQTQQRINTALAGQDKWPELVKRIDDTTERLKDTNLQGIIDQPELHALAYLHVKRTDTALALLEPQLKRQTANVGEDHFLTALTRGLYATALLQKGQGSAARPLFERTLQHFTSPESVTGDFSETAMQRKIKRFISQHYMQLLAQTATTNKADAQLLFQVADRVGASSVQQALTEAAVRAGVNVPGLADIIRKEQDAKNEVASLNVYIANQNAETNEKRNPQVVEQMRQRKLEIEAQRKGYKAQIQKQFPEYFQLIQPKSPSHTEIAQQLRPDELFVTIMPMDDKTYVWAIDASRDIYFHSVALTESEIDKLVTNIRKTLDVAELGSKAPAFDHASSHRLFQALLGPIEKQLDKKTHLIVSTNGPLAKLPFAVLVRSPSSTTPSQTAWLIKDVAISHIPSASGWLALKNLRPQQHSHPTLMAWGDPAFDPKATATHTSAASAVRAVASTRATSASNNVLDADAYLTYSKLPPLPETRDEVLELAKIMSADPKQDVILGAEATRQSVLKSNRSGLLAKKQVVVFATHGLLAGDLPNLNQPALAMAGNADPKESPLLTLEDVLSLQLQADWVVLSACNTAGADGKAEEALSGLARGFFFAGSRSLLVTHWSVESESAMRLTTQTFSTYQKDPQIRRSEALRQAMLTTMATPKFSHPTYWAPYALVGEGGR